MENTQIFKTINILKKEFENNLIQLIQNSNMPACILQDILSKYLRQLQDLADEDYKRDLQQLKKQNQQNENNNQQNKNESNQN